MTIICGCDPGNSGAFAFLNTEENTMRLFDMPIFEWETTRARKKIDEHTVARYMRGLEPNHIVLEEVWSSPQMGVVSAFSFGLGRGIIEGVAGALEIPMTQVKPSVWKKELKVPADKRAAVQRASQLFPALSDAFVGPRGGVIDGRAEAALLAFYGCLSLNLPITGQITRVE